LYAEFEIIHIETHSEGWKTACQAEFVLVQLSSEVGRAETDFVESKNHTNVTKTF